MTSPYLPPRDCLVLYDMSPDDESSDGIILDTRYESGRWFFAIDPTGDIDMERVVDWCERPDFGGSVQTVMAPPNWDAFAIPPPPMTEEPVPPTLRNVGDEP